MADTLDDLALLDRWRTGDREAGQTLFARHFTSVYGFFQNKCPAEADELVQTTFMACLRARDQFRKEASFRTYLFTIARHELYRALEERKRDAERLDFEVSSIAQLITSPATKLVRDQEQRLLLAGLRQLPVAQQTLLELHYFEELAIPDLAIVFETSDGNIRVRLHRARTALRERMEGIAPPDALASEDTLDGWAKQVLDR